MARRKAQPRERYTRENAPRCRCCGATAVDWKEVEGSNWSIKLTRDSRGWICQFCEIEVTT